MMYVLCKTLSLQPLEICQVSTISVQKFLLKTDEIAFEMSSTSMTNVLVNVYIELKLIIYDITFK